PGFPSPPSASLSSPNEDNRQQSKVPRRHDDILGPTAERNALFLICVASDAAVVRSQLQRAVAVAQYQRTGNCSVPNCKPRFAGSAQKICGARSSCSAAIHARQSKIAP